MDYRYSIDFGSGYVDVPQPANHAAVKVDIVFTSGAPSASISSITFEWLGETAEKINKYIAQGLTGGRGIYEGLPLKIEACNQNLGFDLVLDLTNPESRFECNRVLTPIKESGRIDWLNDVAGSFTFSYLAIGLSAGQPGFIDSINDYKKTPYVISSIPDYTQVITLSIDLFLITLETVRQLKILAGLIKRVINELLNLPPQIGEIIWLVLEVIAEIAFVYVLINKIITLIDQIKNNIIQDKKYKYCMRVKDLFTKGCEYLGLTFQSSIFESGQPFENLTWMPAKIVKPNMDGILSFSHSRPEDEASGLGNPYGYYDGTFKEFIQDMMTLFNADILVNNGVLQFEEKHYWNVLNPFTVPNTAEEGFTYNEPEPHGTNANECPSVLELQFQLDNNELNTIHRYEGTTCQVVISPNVVGNKAHLLNQNGINIQFPCALGKRKSYLTPVEQFLSDNVDLINAMIDPNDPLAIPSVVTFLAFTTATSLAGVIGAAFFIGLGGFDATKINTSQIPVNTWTQRFGWLELSNDSFSIPKVFIGEQTGDDWTLGWRHDTYMNAAMLMNAYWGKNLATRGNQYLTYFDKKFPFCCKDFQQVLNSNVLKVQDTSGAWIYGKFTKLTWSLEEEMVDTADYRINRNFTNNLKETIWIDGTELG